MVNIKCYITYFKGLMGEFRVVDPKLSKIDIMYVGIDPDMYHLKFSR